MVQQLLRVRTSSYNAGGILLWHCLNGTSSSRSILCFKLSVYFKSKSPVLITCLYLKKNSCAWAICSSVRSSAWPRHFVKYSSSVSSNFWFFVTVDDWTRSAVLSAKSTCYNSHNTALGWIVTHMLDKCESTTSTHVLTPLQFTSDGTTLTPAGNTVSLVLCTMASLMHGISLHRNPVTVLVL